MLLLPLFWLGGGGQGWEVAALRCHWLFINRLKNMFLKFANRNIQSLAMSSVHPETDCAERLRYARIKTNTVSSVHEHIKSMYLFGEQWTVRVIWYLKNSNMKAFNAESELKWCRTCSQLSSLLNMCLRGLGAFSVQSKHKVGYVMFVKRLFL